MNHILEAKSGTGQRLPDGGEVVGHLADAFQLKRHFTHEKGWVGSKKTPQRLFNGQQDKVSPETATEIIDHLVRCFFEQAPFPEELIERVVAEVLDEAYQGWNAVSGFLNATSFPNPDLGLAALPVIRLAAWSLAIRVGAFLYLEHRVLDDEDLPEDLFDPWWLTDQPVKVVFDRYREVGEGITLEDFATRSGYGFDEIINWRSGKHRPAPERIDDLASLLSQTSGEEAKQIAAELWSASGVAYIRRRLSEICGDERIEDLVAGVRHVVELTFGLHRAAERQFGAGETVEIVRNVLLHGPRCEHGAGVAHFLYRVAQGSQFVAADMQALPGNWSARLLFWAKRLAQSPNELEDDDFQLLVDSGLSSEAGKILNKLGFELMLRTRDFNEPESVVLSRLLEEYGVEVGGLGINAEVVDALRKFELYGEAEAMFSVGNVLDGITLLQQALLENPDDAFVRYTLGCKMAMYSAGQREVVEAALAHCREAARLAPEWGRPLHEVGSLLSNLGRLDEAAEAFARAEPFNESWHKFHYAYGQNMMWRREYRAAIERFERCLELDPKFEHARLLSGVCFMSMGNRSQGKRLLKSAGRKTGVDLLTGDGWRRFRDGPVPRD